MRRNMLLLLLVGCAVALMTGTALAAGGSIRVSDHRLVYTTAGDINYFGVQNNSSTDVATSAPVLTGDTSAFTWVSTFSDECFTGRPTIGPTSASNTCFYDFQFNPPAPGTYKATATVTVGDRTFKVHLVGTST